MDNIFNVTKVQKLGVGKKRKDENLIIKGSSNYSSSQMTKSLGKNKAPKLSNKDRHISMEKYTTRRETQTKTQTGFYVCGGGIRPEIVEQEHSG